MSAFDSNRDGYLDPSERQDAREFRAGDVTGDGALNINEFARIEDPRKFNMYDTNHDGIVDTPEFARGERATEHPCK